MCSRRWARDLADRFTVGQGVAILPTMGLPSGYSPGYSYPYFGGDATYCIVPAIAIEKGCVLPYDDGYFANASLAEPMSCIIGAFRSNYHTEPLVWEHQMGLRRADASPCSAAGCHGHRRPRLRPHGPFTPTPGRGRRRQRGAAGAAACAVPAGGGAASRLPPGVRGRQRPGRRRGAPRSPADGYDDVVVFAAIKQLVEPGDAVLARDGCLNFFAGPTDRAFSACLNLYNVHYEGTHLVGTSGGSRSDMEESLELSAAGTINPSRMVTHVGGLDAVPDALSDLPPSPAGRSSSTRTSTWSSRPSPTSSPGAARSSVRRGSPGSAPSQRRHLEPRRGGPRAGGLRVRTGSGLTTDVELVGLEDEIGAVLPVSYEPPEEDRARAADSVDVGDAVRGPSTRAKSFST